MKFQLIATDSATDARAGTIETSRGQIETPIFMPVGTAGTVKAIHQRELHQDIGAQVILGNTYHLYLRPGLQILEAAGGLHGFNGWEGPVLTDSGGYQIYSLGSNRKIQEEGVIFRSHIDGSSHEFTPEGVVDIQRTIGADFIMAFDECTPYPCERTYAQSSMHLTHRWLDRCMDRFSKTREKYGHPQSLLPIVQGSVFSDLRKQSAAYVSQLDVPAIAIGGLSVGEPAEDMYAMTKLVCDILPREKPRYLMGVGTPANLLECIARGVDMFDCVMPTRNARNGMLFTTAGMMNIRNEKWKSDFRPLDSGLVGYASNQYSRAYVRHLVIANEMLGAQIASLHNLTFYLWLVKQARKHILDGDFAVWKKFMLEKVTKRL